MNACAHIAPGTARFEVAVAQSDFECIDNLVLHPEFESPAAPDACQNHPQHLAPNPFIRAVGPERQCIDYLA
jgi:hypothetical protein